jgi:putative membrane protein
MRAIVIRVLINAVALWVAAAIFTNISVPEGDFLGLLLVAAVFGLVNAFIRPIVKLFSLPLLMVTLGLFAFVINAAMLLIVDAIDIGLEVDGFLAALGGAVVISIVSALLSMFVKDSD